MLENPATASRDSFNDTRPMVMEKIAEIRKAIEQEG